MTMACSAHRPDRGLTLIELSISLAIIGVLLSAAVIGVGALTGTRAKAAAAQLGAVMRSLYDTATVSGKTCRLVFELPGERDEKPSVKYSAECAAGGIYGSIKEAVIYQALEK